MTDEEICKFYCINITKLNQAQFDTALQLNILIQVGNKLGLYDAVDLIKILAKIP